MKKILAISTALVAVMIFTGCNVVSDGGSEDSDGERYPGTHYTFVQELPGGGEVLCVWAKSGYGGGLSCDW